MHNGRFLTVLLGLALSLSFNAWSAAGVPSGKNTPPPKDEKDFKWAATAFDDAKKSEKPVLLLVRSEKDKTHPTVKKLKDLLDDAGVKAELSKFTKAEVSMTDTHGWKDGLGAAFPMQGDERLLVIAFQDHKPTVIQMFGQDQASMKPDVLLAALEAAEKVKDANKVADKK